MAGQLAQRLGVLTVVEVNAANQLLLQDDEQLHSTYPQVRFVLGQDAEQESGTLFISSRRIAWKCDTGPTAFAIKYHQVAMHAISRDTDDFPSPCIYLQLDEGSDAMDDGDDEDDDAAVPEVRLVPSDPSQLESLFKALCECATLNPDSDMEEEAQNELFFDKEEVLAGAGGEQRADMLAHYDNLLEMPSADTLDELLVRDPSRFDDANDDEDEDVESVSNGHMQPPRQ